MEQDKPKRKVAVISVFDPDGETVFYRMMEVDSWGAQVQHLGRINPDDPANPEVIGIALTFQVGALNRDD